MDIPNESTPIGENNTSTDIIDSMIDDMVPDNNNKEEIKVPEVEKNEYPDEVKRLINVDENKWNIHMLRVCTRHLTNLNKKDFKSKRYVAIITKNSKLEKQILEQMLCDKSKLLSSEEFRTYYKSLTKFVAVRHLHPRKKYIDY